jgi:mRNA turnover protein 4
MSHALGRTPETAHSPNTHALTPYLTGAVGLLFTSQSPSTIISHFSTFSETDYARSGTVSTTAFTLPSGMVYSRGGELDPSDDVPMAHSLEPELRRLGVPTRLDKGRIMLESEYEVCREGEVLDSRQTRLLKLFGVATAEFRVKLLA